MWYGHHFFFGMHMGTVSAALFTGTSCLLPGKISITTIHKKPCIFFYKCKACSELQGFRLWHQPLTLESLIEWAELITTVDYPGSRDGSAHISAETQWIFFFKCRWIWDSQSLSVAHFSAMPFLSCSINVWFDCFVESDIDHLVLLQRVWPP